MYYDGTGIESQQEIFRSLENAQNSHYVSSPPEYQLGSSEDINLQAIATTVGGNVRSLDASHQRKVKKRNMDAGEKETQAENYTVEMLTKTTKTKKKTSKICHVCQHSVANRKQLKRHLMEMHGSTKDEARQWVCVNCDERFNEFALYK